MPTRNLSNLAKVGVKNNAGSLQDIKESTALKTETLGSGCGPRYGYPKLLGKRNVGGVFYLVKNEVLKGSKQVSVKGAGIWSNYKYSGLVVSDQTYLATPTVKLADPYASEAYEKCRPDKANWAGLNALYELKDLPGMLRQRFHGSGLHEIGDYYLAQKFGWDPLLRDVRDMVITQMTAQKRLNQLLRDEGRPVRRSVKVYESSDTSSSGKISSVDGGTSPGLVSQFYRNGWTSTETEVFDKVWANAQFRYWLPGGPRDIAWRREILRRINGFRVTPKVIYNAIPWSWLIDWFSNAGSMLANIQSDIADRQAADYGYVMRYSGTILRRNSFVEMLEDAPGTKWFPVSLQCRCEASTKMRANIGPFHPALKENQLSGVQLAIMGALGLSRLR